MTSQAARKILVTSALPYANGPIHIGHLVEYLQTDIWVRFQRMRGHAIWFVCADDAHGTPIMLKAEQDGISPEELIEQVGVSHREDFADFLIEFDNYYTTHSDENRACAEQIFERLNGAGYIQKRTISQAYDPIKQMFLPDRYVRGTCPNCGRADQYGDSCENCGATYSPLDLVEPVSVISGATPVARESEHLFFTLGEFDEFLRDWINTAQGAGSAVQTGIANKLKEWFEQGLSDWDISREAPYFGFQIPGYSDKYFYVWLDAPIGYMASFKNLCARSAELEFDEFWAPDSDAELYHFIGKDIAYFHTLFWPAMLHGAGFRVPTAVFCHGFLTVNGEKMSKRRGTFVRARTYLEHLNPEYLRYYFAAKLGAGIDDIDLNLEDFVQRVNSDLVGKVVNIASRCAAFIHRQFDGQLAAELPEPALQAELVAAAESIGQLYEQREFSKAMREIMALADKVNAFIDEHKPWQLAKQGGQEQQVQAVCTQGIEAFRVLMLYLKPVLPRTAQRAEQFLACAPLQWSDLSSPITGRRIEAFSPLMTRVDLKQVKRMVDASVEDAAQAQSQQSTVTPASPSPGKEQSEVCAPISIDDFQKLDLRVARVRSAELVEGADKLLRVVVELDGGTRTVFAGIREAYEPDKLVGRMVVLVANLKPRKMRFGVSEGMLLAAGPGGSDIFIVSPDEGALPGMQVK